MNDEPLNPQAPPATPAAPTATPATRRRRPATAPRHEGAERGRRPRTRPSTAAPSTAATPVAAEAPRDGRRPPTHDNVTPLRPRCTPAADARPDAPAAASTSNTVWLLGHRAASAGALLAPARGLNVDELWRFRVTLTAALGVDDQSAVARLGSGASFPVPPQYSAPTMRAALEWVEMARDGAELDAAAAAPADAAVVGRVVAARLDAISWDDRWRNNRLFRYCIMLAFDFDSETVSGFLRDGRAKGVTYLRTQTKTVGVRAAMQVVESLARRAGVT
jgi:hypothetical protein